MSGFTAGNYRPLELLVTQVHFMGQGPEASWRRKSKRRKREKEAFRLNMFEHGYSPDEAKKGLISLPSGHTVEIKQGHMN